MNFSTNSYVYIIIKYRRNPNYSCIK